MWVELEANMSHVVSRLHVIKERTQNMTSAFLMHESTLNSPHFEKKILNKINYNFISNAFKFRIISTHRYLGACYHRSLRLISS